MNDGTGHQTATVAQDWVLVPRIPTPAMLGYIDRNAQISAETHLVLNKEMLWAGMLAASPEPVPATNQAGEVERREAMARVIDPWAWEMFDNMQKDTPNYALKQTWLNGCGDDGVNSRHALSLAKAERIAALATQPATSQEGESKLDWRKIAKAAGEHGVRYRTNTALERFLSEIAATPTPPASMSHRCETCCVKDGHAFGCSENVPPDDADIAFAGWPITGMWFDEAEHIPAASPADSLKPVKGMVYGLVATVILWAGIIALGVWFWDSVQ